MRLLDRRFAGVARGVGTAQILGRVHSAQLKLADLHLACSFTIMEGRDVDLLFGLDMLKAHQACIDLEKNVLRIGGREVKFLSEHELSENARLFQNPPNELIESSSAGLSAAGGSSSSSRSQPQHFPGSGSTLGAAPRSGASVTPSGGTRYPESMIKTLMDLGATREAAVSALEAAGGNVDYAASMLF